ncbi:MAG: hypothetical protein EA404_00845 [Spirochaetaceae bacterium]|nr:MAG: hypothetical protein EA404_00845 [Spirochaetaceae bacterium]
MQQNNTISKSKPAVTLRLAFAALALIVFAGCDLPHSNAPAEHGSLRITISSQDGMQPLTLLPDASMEPAFYAISGSGPFGESFETTTSGGAAEISGLRAGEWEIEVSAVNAEQTEIGYGKSTVAVEPGGQAAVSIAVRPLSGTGSLSLWLSWPADQVSAPAVTASLTAPAGQPQPLQFALDQAAGTADYHNAETEAGYYTLALQLTDDGAVIAGAVETVRIVRNGHTEGHFSFDDLNHPTGTVDIIVSPDMEDPLEVQIDGAAAVVAYGESQSAAALVTNADGAELDYAWYLNGSHVGAAATVVLDSTLQRGSYRLDLVVFAAGGSRSGSASHSFQVE